MMHAPREDYFYRQTTGPYGTAKGSGVNGAYIIPAPIIKRNLYVIASNGSDWEEEKLPPPIWEHVSVHAGVGSQSYTPTWTEMCYIKCMFWDAEDCVIQFHPPESVYKNIHPNTLHLWRVVGVLQPMPPLETI